ncbi:c-type cytochrome [Sulfitobacter aestuariivivens]|uniref:C-type cytochrome n=1 Tax=Sulfitobacter aestuariivivens TaxID=2766981 RepID=A0A927D5R2_9RHOB|nr:c-type cytochrome [Sulfitobacter aestuariivivens]MBD3665464.1 c-type cytochrome [Sulfitobacter aestuariivivens]
MRLLSMAALATGLMTTTAFADGHATGDAEAGEKVFSKCKACHSIVDADGEAIQKGGRNGPNLYGIFERVAGSDEEFGKKYGDDLVAAGEGGLVWIEEAFVPYVQDPRAFLRETLDDSKARSKMTFKLRDEEDAANVWAYLVSVGPAPEEEATN